MQQNTSTEHGTESGPSTSMASSSSLAETILENFLKCRVCLDPYSDPRALRCQHGFCLKCLEGLVASRQDKSTIVCPTCRKKSKVPKDGVKKLPAHFFVSSLKDTVDAENKVGHPNVFPLQFLSIS